MNRKRLPIGIQDFRTMRTEGFHYVDKTPLIRQMVDEGRRYFLSRRCRLARVCSSIRSGSCSRVARRCSKVAYP